MTATGIIKQTFQDADTIDKEIEKLHYPQRFKISLFRQLPKAQLSTFYEIQIQSDKVLSTVNLHVSGRRYVNFSMENDN